jgi:monovalent cation:proton antiporter-2 (CPA2) family protein
MDTTSLLSTLVIVWLAAKVGGEIAARLGQPPVLGELLAGLVVGPGVLGVVHDSEVLHALAEIGVILLLFEVGLESDLDELTKAGMQSAAVALTGVAVPFVLGFATLRLFGSPTLVAIFAGAALTATSVGITARVLADLGQLRDASARVVLGAAIIDDIIGLIVLAIVSGLAATGEVSVAQIGLLSLKACVFLAAALILGVRFSPWLVESASRMRARGTLIVTAVVFAVALAAIADLMGLATIIGAFAAGVALTRTERRVSIEERVRPVSDLFVPIFFVSIGLKVDPRTLNPFGEGALGFALVLTAVAIVSKLAAGLAVYRRGVRRWAVGVGMVPRGEVGLIFAGIGLSSGVIDEALYAAVIVMVMLTTFVTPPWLKALYGRT